MKKHAFGWSFAARILAGLSAVFAFAATAFLALAISTHVPDHITEQDALAIMAMLRINNAPPHPDSYEEELRLIRMAQHAVMDAAPGNTPIEDAVEREPMDLLRARSGLCYDRSRSIDKALSWLGFDVRHVYILFDHEGKGTGLLVLLRRLSSRSYSHAVTEVRTRRGWLVVDSNERWLSVDRHGLPVHAGALHAARHRFEMPPQYTAQALWAIRGLYSRRGQFYRPFIYFPELNWREFLKWVFFDREAPLAE